VPAKRTEAKKSTQRSTRQRADTSTSAVKVRRGPKSLTPAHKAAMAKGRLEARHVGAYLDALAEEKAHRGRQRSATSVRRELTRVEQQLGEAGGVKRLELLARRLELRSELDTRVGPANRDELRKNFVKYAGSYARRKGIPRQAFVDAGVPPADIAAAKIP
jgi:hypothetical protein